MTIELVVEWEVIDHGEDGSQYFSECGVAYSRFTHVATGAADTAKEALDDALEQIATSGHDVSDAQAAEMLLRLSDHDRSAHLTCEPGWACKQEDSNEEHDWHHYISVRYNVQEVAE